MVIFLRDLFFKNKQKRDESDVCNPNIANKKPNLEESQHQSHESDPLVQDNVVERDKYERVILLTDLLTESGLTSQELDTLSHHFETKALSR